MFTVFDINLFYMRNRIMILCTFCAIAIFSSAQGKFSIKGNAGRNGITVVVFVSDG